MPGKVDAKLRVNREYRGINYSVESDLESHARFEWISPDKVKISDFRVRISIDREKLEDLKRSIKRRSLLHPIVVKENDDGTYTLIAGERRLIASKELGLKKIPAIVRRTADADSVLIEMGIENIQREDLSYYERGRWVAKMRELGWTITALAEETGIPNQSLFDWLEFYNESERIKRTPDYREAPIEKLPLTGLLGVKRAPIPEEKKTELAIEASKMPEPPTVSEIQRATRIIEQEPQISAKEAIARARGITYLIPIPIDLMPKIRAKSEEWNLTIQETIIRILREYFE